MCNFFPLVNQPLTLFHPRVTYSPAQSPDPEKIKSENGNILRP